MSAYSDRVIADGAVAYWRLDETSGTTAASLVGSYPGTISGGVTLNQSGALTDGDKAMLFDGATGKVLTAANVTIPLAATIEAWIKLANTTAELPVIGRTAGSGTEIIFGVLSRKPYIFGGTNGGGGNRIVTDGQWHHLSWVLSSATCTVFVDGAVDNTFPFLFTASVRPASIGWDQYGSFWPGSLDDIAIYPTALTPQQIAAHYAIGSGPTAAQKRRRRFRAHAC